MSVGMLGRLPLPQVRGPVDTLMTNLAGRDGEAWLDALKRFNRQEDPWPGSRSRSGSSNLDSYRPYADTETRWVFYCLSREMRRSFGYEDDRESDEIFPLFCDWHP